MDKVTDEALNEVFSGIISDEREELRSMSDPSSLERYWYFSYDHDASLEWNLYKFNQLLDIYRHKCRRWEEMHNGNCCVVERVRDAYVMPKIKDLINLINATKPNHVRLPTSRDEAEMMILVGERYLSTIED